MENTPLILRWVSIPTKKWYTYTTSALVTLIMMNMGVWRTRMKLLIKKMLTINVAYFFKNIYF